MHKRHIIHRDIKLDNILISYIEEGTQLNIKISDFGLSQFLPINNEELLYAQCGTPCYIAPEIL
jgi:serine/threonine protein kinase